MTKGKTKIRKAGSEDLDAIGTLWQELMDFHRERDPHFVTASDGQAQFKEFIAGHIAADTSCVLIAESDGDLAGYCLATMAKYPPVFESRDYGAVFDLAVTARCRRTGIGEKMYRAAEAWFAEHGVHRIEIRVMVANEISTAFWKKMGFQPYISTVFKHI